jgi:hypothetical protein
LICYLDTSAIASLVLAEDRMPLLTRLFAETRTETTFSDFGRAELASAVAQRVRMSAFTGEAARTLLRAFDLWAATRLRCIAIETADIDRGTMLVERFDLKLRAPDALHLAIAERVRASLVTFDRKQATAAQQIQITVVDN